MFRDDRVATARYVGEANLSNKRRALPEGRDKRVTECRFMNRGLSMFLGFLKGVIQAFDEGAVVELVGTNIGKNGSGSSPISSNNGLLQMQRLGTISAILGVRHWCKPADFVNRAAQCGSRVAFILCLEVCNAYLAQTLGDIIVIVEAPDDLTVVFNVALDFIYEEVECCTINQVVHVVYTIGTCDLALATHELVST